MKKATYVSCNNDRVCTRKCVRLIGFPCHGVDQISSVTTSSGEHAARVETAIDRDRHCHDGIGNNVRHGVDDLSVCKARVADDFRLQPREDKLYDLSARYDARLRWDCHG